MANPADQYFFYEEWELPPEAKDTQWREEITISLRPNFAFQAHRIYTRLLWNRESPNHVNPRAPAEANGRKLY